MKKNIRMAEIFAGVGGFRIAFEWANHEFFKTVFANQWDAERKEQAAYNCYVENFGHEMTEKEIEKHYSNEEIHELNNRIQKDPSSIPNFDLLVGSFPYQDNSVVSNQRKGVRGNEGVLWWELERLIRYKEPKYLLLESLDRLLRLPVVQRGKDFLIMLKTLDSLGYNVEWNVINAHDYGHVQKRKRIFIFAWKQKDSEFEKENKSKTLIMNDSILTKQFNHWKVMDKDNLEMISHYDLKQRSLERISKSETFDFENYGYCIDGKVTTYRYEPLYAGDYLYLQDVLQDEEEIDKSYILSAEQRRMVDSFREGSSVSQTEQLDKYARTLLPTEGTVNRTSHIILHSSKPKKYRFLTPVEAERIMELPDNWTVNMPSDRSRYIAIGKELVVGVVEKIAITLEEKLTSS